MLLKLYTRPYSAKNLQRPIFTSLHSPTQTSRFQATDFFTSPSKFDTLTEESKQLDNIQSPSKDSEYRLNFNFPERPQSSTLSSLTMKENERNLNQSRSLNKIFNPTSFRYKHSEHPTWMPSEDDFSKIITKLEMVSTNRTAGTRRIMMNEGDKIEILMESGETQYFTVNSKGKKPPLVVNVKTTKGRVISYASKVHSEPSKDICEVSSRSETFQVKDVSIKFRIDAIYIGIEALTDSIFTVSIAFGQSLNLRSSKSLRVTQEEREIIERPEREYIPRKKKKPSTSKDFVKLNIEKSKLKNPETTKKIDWDFKKESVRIRRKQLFEEKKQRTLTLIKRKGAFRSKKTLNPDQNNSKTLKNPEKLEKPSVTLPDSSSFHVIPGSLMTPTLNVLDLQASSIAVSSNFLAVYYLKPEAALGTLSLFEYPLLTPLGSTVIKIQKLGKVLQMEIVAGYLLVISDHFQTFTLPDLRHVFSSDISPSFLSIDKHEVALLMQKRVVVFSLTDFSITSEHSLKGEYRRVTILSGFGVLLQSRYNLHFMDFNAKGPASESCVFELKKPGFKGILNLEQPSTNVLHVQQYSLICVTSNNCSFFVDYQFRQYVRYPSVRHSVDPVHVAFLHPCYLLGFYPGSVSVFLVHTGENLETLNLSSLSALSALGPSLSLNFEVSSSTSSDFLVKSNNSLLSFTGPSLDVLVPSALSKQRFEVALEICRDTCPSMTGRVYFEHAVHCFFNERDYQRASHYFRKSEETWAVCSLLRKILPLPPVVHSRCEEQFELACKRASRFSILPSHLDFMKQRQVLSYDFALKIRIVQNFVPFFALARKTDDENLKFFAETWLFAGFLFLPAACPELLALLRDSNNVLPLRYCAAILREMNRVEEITELFIARKVYRAGLEILFEKYLQDRRRYWLVLVREFLMQLVCNPQCFVEFLQRLFCESTEEAEILLLAYPKILEQVDVLNVLIPIMFKYSGTKLVINFLNGRDSLEESNFLAKLFIEEASQGNVNPKDLLMFLSSRPIKYDPSVVLTYFPKHLLQRERCLVLDVLGKYEEIIHYYLYKEGNIEIAKKYVEHKRNPKVSSIFLMKITKSPMSSEAKTSLISFLNDSDPEIIDHNVVSSNQAFTVIPHDLQIEKIFKYLFKAFYFIQGQKEKMMIQKNLQEKYLIDLLASYFVYAEKSVEIHEDSRCDFCYKKIKTKDFVVSLNHDILHLTCYEK